jgi:hypothetical protein
VQALAAGAEELRQRPLDRVQVSLAGYGKDGFGVDQDAAQPVAPGVRVLVERGPGHVGESMRRTARRQ